ncbi:hypothetical protein GGD63_001727 [Bradyrhizobium sp. cir1]|nr:hypothetical protein [Bradyrhizobium sp. cir1]MBB4368948.1 hypothetical protein [Bradyrhizobium sp. cir1]
MRAITRPGAIIAVLIVLLVMAVDDATIFIATRNGHSDSLSE